MYLNLNSYFNPQVLNKYGLPIPSNITTLISDTQALAKDKITAWIIPGGDGGWDQLNVWEDIFLGLGGNTLYDELMYGTLNLGNPHVMNIINQTNNDYTIFQNDSYSGEASMTWTQAISDVTSGNAVFQVNGNWYTNYAYDYLNAVDYPAVSPYTSWTNISLMSTDFPNTSKYFVMITDSVAVPTGPTQGGGLVLAKYFASYAGQKIFTQWKAVTFYDNITTDYYNTPAQWYSYQQAKNTTSSDWVYQLSDGGLFAGPLATVESAMSAFSESFTSSSSSGALAGAESVLVTQLKSVVSTENSSWQAANSLGLGYMGSSGHPFGGYLPYWANTTANATASASTLSAVSTTTGNVSAASSNNANNAPTTVYIYLSTFGLSYLENMVVSAMPKL